MAWQRDFWRTVPLAEMTPYQWELVCDGCGKCCLQKLEDEDTGEIYYTDLSCRLLDNHSCRCTDYPHRLARVPECLDLKPGQIGEFHWLPATCAYRLLAEGADLPDWHPLISGTPESVHTARMSVRGRCQSETQVPERDWEEHIIQWVDL